MTRSTGVQAVLGDNGYEVPDLYDSKLTRHTFEHEAMGVPFDPSLPVLLIGGDHPYQQWIGDSSHDGTLDYYRDHGITPYIAINTCAESGSNNPGDAFMMSWDAVRAIQSNVEIMSHGGRHIQAWTKINTGLKITYSGANATATVHCDGTNLVLTDSGATNIALAGKTLATLADAVAAVTGWTCSLAGELTGTEDATKVLTVAAGNAKNAKAPLIARMAAGGGIVIKYTGSAYRHAWVWRATNLLILYGDGVPVAYIDTTNASYDTYGELVTYINTLTGWTAYLSDNDNSVASNTDNYISGGEASSNLKVSRFPDCINSWAILTGGLDHSYMIRRQLKTVIDTATENGVTVKNYAQSGGSAFQEVFQAHTDLHGIFRGNDQFAMAYMPGAWQLGTTKHVFPHYSISDTTGYNVAGRAAAIVDALADSKGFAVCALVHEIDPDGSTGRTFLASKDTGALTETYAAEMVERISTLKASGRIAQLTPEQMRKIVISARATNKLFNPRLKNSGETLTGVSNNLGTIIPGWKLNTPAQFTAATIADGAISLVSNATTLQSPLAQYVYLEPGKTYRVQCRVAALAISSGSGIQLAAVRAVDPLAISASPAAAQTAYTTYQTTPGVLDLVLTVPPQTVVPAFVRSINAQTFDLSTNANIRVNIDSKGLTADINCAGSTPAATTAKEIAAAINAALAANANYPAEYHTCARAENGRVIIQAPYAYASGAPDSYNVVVQAGSTASALTTIFGGVAQNHISLGKNATLLPEKTSWWLVSLNFAVSGSAEIGDFSITEL